MRLSYGLPMPGPEQVASEFETYWSGEEHQEVPRLVRESLVLLYPAGYALVTQILDAGGVAALDAALRGSAAHQRGGAAPGALPRPLPPRAAPVPSSSRPERIAPSSECTMVGANTFGEFGLRIWAQERGMGSPEAAAAAEGWDADRAVVFDCPTGRAFAWLMQFESAAKAREFAETARRLARPSTRVDDSGTRVLLWANLDQGGRDAALLETESRIYRGSVRVPGRPPGDPRANPRAPQPPLQPAAARAVATTPARPAAASARGICDFTWSIRSQPVNMLRENRGVRDRRALVAEDGATQHRAEAELHVERIRIDRVGQGIATGKTTA